MQATRTAQQIQTLYQIKLENYRAAGEYKPEIAAQFAVEGIVAMYRNQPQHINQLLDEEIEDAQKTRKQ